MDVSEIVRTVTRQVLHRLGHAPGPVVRVLQSRDAALEHLVRERLGDGVSLVFSGETAEGGEEREPERYILPFLCCSGMADLALGRASGPVAPEVLRLLLAGKKVEVLEYEYVRFASSAPKPLYALYVSYRKTLEGYGLTACVPARPAAQSRNRVLTERDVLKAAAAGETEIALPAGTRMTPLAADTARLRGLTIRKDSAV